MTGTLGKANPSINPHVAVTSSQRCHTICRTAALTFMIFNLCPLNSPSCRWLCGSWIKRGISLLSFTHFQMTDACGSKGEILCRDWSSALGQTDPFWVTADCYRLPRVRLHGGCLGSVSSPITRDSNGRKDDGGKYLPRTCWSGLSS